MTAAVQTLAATASIRRKMAGALLAAKDLGLIPSEAKAPARPAAPPVTPARLALKKGSLILSNIPFLKDPAGEHGRQFLFRVFSVDEIQSVEINRVQGSATLRHAPAVDPAPLLRKLQTALTLNSAGWKKFQQQDPIFHRRLTRAVETLYLDNPNRAPIRITDVDGYLTTWRIGKRTATRVRLIHPILRHRRDIAYRLEEELTAVQGVRKFRSSPLTSSIVIHFDPRRLDVPRLLRHLEYCWPRLVDGLSGPPPRIRFFASTSLLTLAFTGQYFFPPLTPFVLAGVAIYSFPNVVNAVKQLTHGKIGLPALYTGTITFTVLSGMPFSATFMATFMQLWPQWSHRTLVKSQRRLFANHRQRAIWARVLSDGQEVELNIDRVEIGDLVLVREGEIIPVDGVVTGGLAAVDEEALTGRAGALDKATGDLVYAATYVKAGQLAIRVTKTGVKTLAGYIGAQLPHGKFERLPSSAHAEEIANKMVLPALALAGANLALGGSVLASQATIRPDYATAPRFSAQLATLHDISDALRRGILFRDPAALSRLPATDIYVFDDSSALLRRRISVADIITASGVDEETLLSYAASAFPAYQNNRARALMELCLERRAPLLEISQRSRDAGVIRYRDPQGRSIEVATPAYIESQGIKVPASVRNAVRNTSSAWAPRARGARQKPLPHPEPQVRPLWILRDGEVLGVVTFQRQGELEGVEVIATLRARNAQASFVHISSRPQKEAEAIAHSHGIVKVHGGLDTEGKVRVLKQLGKRTLWLGDGSLPESLPCIEAATISISLAGAQTVLHDAAGIVFLQPTLLSLVPLRRIGRRHRALLKSDYRAIFAANLFCVAGAFFGGFNTLAVAITSNSATGYVYFSHRLLLSDLITRMEAKMAKDQTYEAEDHDPDEGTSKAAHYELEYHEDYAEYDLDAPVFEERPI